MEFNVRLTPTHCGLAEAAISRDPSGSRGLPPSPPALAMARDFPQPGDIESRIRRFSRGYGREIAAGNDAATMFTQTPKAETIPQDSRVRARGLARSCVCVCVWM